MEKIMINAYDLLTALKQYRDDDPIDECDTGLDSGIWKAQQLVKQMMAEVKT